MYLSIALRSILIGISIAAPVGPIGILCIRRTLAEGRIAGFISGLGAATADAFYGAIAAFGLTFISLFLLQHTFWLRLGGGIFLLFLGVRIFLAIPASSAENETSPGKKRGLLNYYASTFLLTITNPLTILSFAAIFAGIGGLNSKMSNDYIGAAIMVMVIVL
jgi:threonine/homoserine/homoserine lactone efflux protein